MKLEMDTLDTDVLIFLLPIQVCLAKLSSLGHRSLLMECKSFINQNFTVMNKLLLCKIILWHFSY